jgi:hypothetical protein
MSNFETHEVFADSDSNLYFRMEGVWTTVVGTSLIYDGHKELKKAYADDNNKLCWKQADLFRIAAGTECPKHPAPRPLSADEFGVLYVYHDGAYALMTLA